MNIYTQNDIKRMAGSLLLKDFEANKDFHFTNTSYGGKGEVMGTIEAKNRKGESLIQYSLVSKHWDDDNYDLIKTTESKIWKTNDTPFSRTDDEQLIKRFYKISRDSYDYAVYSDDEEYAKNANKIRLERYRRDDEKPTKRNYQLDGNHTIKPFTPLYDKLFTWMTRTSRKQLKYGTDMQVGISKFDNQTKYDWNTDTRTTGTEIQMHVRVMYRNKWLSNFKSRTFVPEKVETI